MWGLGGCAWARAGEGLEGEALEVVLVSFLLVLVEVEEGEGEMAEERGLLEGVEAGVRGLEVSRPAAEEDEVGGGDLTVEEEEERVGLEGVLLVVVDFLAD